MLNSKAALKFYIFTSWLSFIRDPMAESIDRLGSLCENLKLILFEFIHRMKEPVPFVDRLLY